MNKAEEIRRINACISDLVYDKVQLRKAYNYYHCKRDAEQFRSIEENYGIGTPTSVGFTPLIKKHIDVLVGEYLELDPDLQVSCKDDATVTNIMRDKQLKIHAEAFKFFKQRLESAIIQIFLEGKNKFDDPYFEQEIARIKKDVEKSYVSEYEMAAQNILNYIKHSRDIDLKNKMRELLTDLLIGGMCYFRTKPSGSKTGLELEILNPIDTFVERNHNEYFLNKSPRAVIRRYLTKDQIKKEFYDELSSEAKAKLNDSGPDELNASNSIYIQVHTMDPIPATPSNSGLLGGLEIAPIRDAQNGYYRSNDNLICVYDCE